MMSLDCQIYPMRASGSSPPKRLITTYLKVWTDYESLERLRACFDLAIKFAPLYYAAIYHAVILPGMTFKWEMNNMIPFYLKKLLPSSQGV